MMLVVFLSFVGVVVWIYRRRQRGQVLAGRVAEKPTYQIDPPRRRMGRLKDGML